LNSSKSGLIQGKEVT